MTKAKDAPARRLAPLDTPTDLRANAVAEISGALNILLADMFALYLKTKNFHWHVPGPHFRDYHLLLDEQAEQIFAATDDIAERVRKIGGTTLRSIGHIGPATRAGQRRRLRHAVGYARRTARRQQAVDGELARGPRDLRQARGRGQRQLDRELDRRGRAAHLVPVRGDPRGKGVSGSPARHERQTKARRRGGPPMEGAAEIGTIGTGHVGWPCRKGAG